MTPEQWLQTPAAATLANEIAASGCSREAIDVALTIAFSFGLTQGKLDAIGQMLGCEDDGVPE